jgi:hypothetical protein
MTTIRAVVRNGRIEPLQAFDLPDGTELVIPVPNGVSDDEEDAPSPEEIARTLAAMDRVVPFEMSEEEEAALEADRKARKRSELSRFEGHSERLRRIWE